MLKENYKLRKYLKIHGRQRISFIIYELNLVNYMKIEMIKMTNYELYAYYTRFCAKSVTCAKLLQWYPTLCNPMDYSLPNSSVHGISRQEYWSGLPFPSPGNFPHPGIELTFLMSPAVAGRFFATSTTWETQKCHIHYFIYSSQNIYDKETVLNPYSTDEESEFL